MGALRASGRVGVIAGAAKLGISLVLALVRRRNLSAVVAPGMLADHARFGVSAAMVTLIARSIRCLLARVRGVDDARGRALAAAVGGAATIVDAPSRRDDIAVYLLCVAVHANALRAVRNGTLPSWQHASAVAARECCLRARNDPDLLRAVLPPRYHGRNLLQLHAADR